MTRDPMARLLRLRQRDVDAASLALSGSLSHEAAAAASLQALEARAKRDTLAASALCELGPGLAALAEAGRRRIEAQSEAARIALERARDRSSVARQALAAARIDAEAVLAVIESHAAAAAALAEKRAAHELDDIGRARRPGRGTLADRAGLRSHAPSSGIKHSRAG